MQRQTSRSSSLFSPRREMDENTPLPLYRRYSGEGRTDISPGSRFQGKLVHLIPVIVVLCLFILWWFSYPVYLETKNGRIAGAHRVMMQNTTSLTSTFPPYPSITE